MSKYYNIAGKKVRVSDHEPNFAMDRFRGRNDIEFYTIDACNTPMSVVSQVEAYCDKHDLDIALFAEVLRDFPDPEENHIPAPEKIQVSQEIADAYQAITGKGSHKKQTRFCEKHNIDWYKMSQGYYTII